METKQKIKTLQQAADILKKEDFKIYLVKQRTINNPNKLVAIEVFCPPILMDERMNEIEGIIGVDNFYLHKYVNTQTIYIILKSKK